MWISGILPGIFSGILFAAQPTYVLHYDQKAVDAKGSPLYVSDAEIASKIPGFAHVGPRVDSCFQSMTHPQFLLLAYPPTVIGPHSALANTLSCELAKDSTQFTCQVDTGKTAVVFGDSPTQYFALGANTPINEAIEIFNAYNNGSIHFKKGIEPWIKSLKIREIERQGQNFILHRSDCGCSDPIKVELKHKNGKPIVTALADLGGMCA